MQRENFLISKKKILDEFFRGVNIYDGKPKKKSDLEKNILKQIKKITCFRKDTNVVEYILERKNLKIVKVR